MDLKHNGAYNELIAFLRAEIRDMKKGMKLPSFRALMQKFSCSQSTVNKVLDELEDDELIERRQASGVYITGNMRKRGDTVLFVVYDITNRNCALVVRDGERAARMQGFHAQVYNYQKKLEPLPEHLLRSCRALVLLVRSEDVDNGMARKFLSELPANLPVVLIESDVPGMREYTFFGYDDYAAGQTAAKIMQKRNVSKVACLGSALSHVSQARLTGFANEWGRYPDIMAEFAVEEFLNRDGLKRVAEADVDGLFISRPDIALQSLCHLEALGLKIPEDLFVVTIAEEHDAKAFPFNVVVIEKPSAKTARDAVRAILAGVHHRKRMPYKVVIPEPLKISS